MDENKLEEVEGEEEVQPFEIDPENPLGQVSRQQLGQLMKSVKEMVGMLEAQWESSRNEFQLTDAHMKALYAYNEEHRTPPPEGMSEEEAEKFDRFNGFDNISKETVVEIFGPEHPIIGLDPLKDEIPDEESQEIYDHGLSMHPITIDRIKSVTNDFFSWMSSLKEYRQIHDAYMELIEFEEEKNIKELEKIAENEENEEKKAHLQKTIEMYYNRKYLDFLSEEVSEKTINRIIKAFSDENKVAYWLDRTRRKLDQMKISQKFILEISQFEKRFLDEKYHHQSNILLLYFMQIIMYTDVYDKHSESRPKIICMVIGLDRFIQNKLKPEERERMLNNILALQDQFLGKLPTLSDK